MGREKSNSLDADQAGIGSATLPTIVDDRSMADNKDLLQGAQDQSTLFNDVGSNSSDLMQK